MKEEMENVSGTDGQNAVGSLRTLVDNGFGGSVDETALVLGRTAEEIEGIMNGDERLDEDLEMKIRGIARERNIEME